MTLDTKTVKYLLYSDGNAVVRIRRLIMFVIGVILLILAFEVQNISDTGKLAMKIIASILIAGNFAMGIFDVWYIYKKYKLLTPSASNEQSTVNSPVDKPNSSSLIERISNLHDQLMVYRERVHTIDKEFGQMDGITTERTLFKKKVDINSHIDILEDYDKDSLPQLVSVLEQQVAELNQMPSTIKDPVTAVEFVYRVIIAKYYLARMRMIMNAVPFDVPKTYENILNVSIELNSVIESMNEEAKHKINTESSKRLSLDDYHTTLKNIYDLQYTIQLPDKVTRLARQMKMSNLSVAELIKLKSDVTQTLLEVNYIYKTMYG